MNVCDLNGSTCKVRVGKRCDELEASGTTRHQDCPHLAEVPMVSHWEAWRAPEQIGAPG